MIKKSFIKSPLTQAVSIALLTIGISACGSSSSSSGGGGGGGGGGAPSFNLNGGAASDVASLSQGGRGGVFYGYNSSGGSTEIRTSGTVDASFTPISINGLGNTGTNPLNVTANTTLAAVTLFPVFADGGAVGMGNNYIHSTGNILRTAAAATANGAVDIAVVDGSYYAPTAGTFNLFIADGAATVATAGTPYFRVGNNLIYLSSGDMTADTVATGVEVAAGTTLTLELNSGNDASISLGNDFVLRGTLTTVDASAVQRGNVVINANFFFADGAINTNGSLDGQAGGNVNLYGGSAVYNRAAINTTGANTSLAASTAGDAGMIDIRANTGVVNTGSLTMDGGNATGAGGTGGVGNTVALYAYGTVANSGNIVANGGSGELAGGEGGGASIQNYGVPNGIYNSGNITANSGDGYLGAASGVGFITEGGTIVSSGNLDASGGNGTAMSPDGGEGAFIGFFAATYSTNGSQPGIAISGAINLSGGNSASGVAGDGGNGGILLVAEGGEGGAVGPFLPGGEGRPMVSLLGYSQIGAKGGDGPVGGNGGGVALYGNEIMYNDLGQLMPGGTITNEAAIDGRGGNTTVSSGATPGYSGGNGGGMNLNIDNGYVGFPENELVNNSGAGDFRGGSSHSGTPSVSSGGNVNLYGNGGVTNSGAYNVSGGNDSYAVTGIGGDAGSINMAANNGSVDNSGTITGNGGTGAFDGGNGAGIFAPGFKGVMNIASVTVNGGAMGSAVAGGFGGDGGCIDLSSPGGFSTNSGALSYTLGGGFAPGNEGGALIGVIPVGSWDLYC